MKKLNLKPTHRPCIKEEQKALTKLKSLAADRE